VPDAEPSLRNTQEPPRQRRWLRRIAWAAGGAALLLIVLAVVVPALLPASFVGRIVARQMSRALGREVTVKRARFSIFSGLAAWGIVVKEREGFGDEDFIRIPELRTIGLRVPSILLSDGADISLVRNEQGLLNTQDMAERPAGDFRFSRLATANVRVRYADLASGGKASVVLSSVEVGPVARGRRPLRIGSRVATGGTVMLFGDLWVTPADEPDRLKAKLAVQSLALGRLAASLAPDRPVPPALRSATLDADLDIEILWERILRGAGTLKLSGLPEIPQLGLAGPEAAIEAVLSGELSAFKPHFTLKASTTPHAQVQLDASLKQIVADGSIPSFEADNYVLDVVLRASADFAKGGLPGTPLDAGRGTLDLGLSGTMAKATVAARSALEGGAVAIDGATEPVPPIRLALDGEFSLKELSAQLTQFALETGGARLTASAHAAPAKGAQVQMSSDGSLPPMTGEAEARLDVDFRQWRPGLRLLAGLPTDKPAAGTIKATERTTLDGKGRHELRVDVDGLPLSQDIPAADRLPILDIMRAVVGGRPEAMDFVASLGADFASTGLRPAAIASNLTGRGELRLARLRIIGSPLFRMLADWSRHPELRNVTFERADAPFTLASGQIKSTVTLPHGGGALVFRGGTEPDGALRYAMVVTKPREVAFIPPDILDYLETGRPLVLISGTVTEPKARIATESILEFTLRRKLGKGVGKAPEPRKAEP